MSLRRRFMVLISVLSLIAALSLAVTSYQFNKSKAHKDAKIRGELVYNFTISSRDYFATTQLPKIYEAAGRNIFIPELMSSFGVTPGVFETFQGKIPDYICKQASKNPLVPSNKADTQELELIKLFHENKNLTEKEGQMEKKGQTYYYFAQPIRVTDATCLECHGDPARAPEEQTEIYGTESGYHWQEGETVSALIVYVPLRKALDGAGNAFKLPRNRTRARPTGRGDASRVRRESPGVGGVAAACPLVPESTGAVPARLPARHTFISSARWLCAFRCSAAAPDAERGGR